MAAFVVFVSVPATEVAELPDAKPVIPETVGADHEYVVFAGTNSEPPFEGVTVNDPAEQIVSVTSEIDGVGLTVTLKVIIVPEQVEPPAVICGVTDTFETT